VTYVVRCPWCLLYSPGVISVVVVGMLVGVCVGVIALIIVLRCLHSVRRYVSHVDSHYFVGGGAQEFFCVGVKNNIEWQLGLPSLRWETE